jgi:hypothetical protein
MIAPAIAPITVAGDVVIDDEAVAGATVRCEAELGGVERDAPAPEDEVDGLGFGLGRL